MKIHFVWLDDGMDCETCGGGYADGGQVYIDDVLVVDMEPVAHCYDSISYSQFEVYEALYKHLGLTELLAKVGEDVRTSYDERAFFLALETLGHTVTEEVKSLYEPSDYYDEDYGYDESQVEDEGSGMEVEEVSGEQSSSSS